MRILINVDEAKDSKGKKAVRVRIGYTTSSSDCLRVENCAMDIYNCVCKAFTSGDGGGWNGGIIQIEGRRS